MAKALMGMHTTPRTVQLLDEVRALRARVAELEAALAEARDVQEDRILNLEEAAAVSS